MSGRCCEGKAELKRPQKRSGEVSAGSLGAERPSSSPVCMDTGSWATSTSLLGGFRVVSSTTESQHPQAGGATH